MMTSPRDDYEGYDSPMEHNADSSDVGGDGATEDNTDSEATGPPASSALANDETSYVQTLTPEWRRIDCIVRKSVTFASYVKEGGVVTVDYDSGDLAMGADDEQMMSERKGQRPWQRKMQKRANLFYICSRSASRPSMLIANFIMVPILQK